MCAKIKALAQKNNQGTENTCDEYSQEKIIACIRHELKIWEDFITHLHDGTNGAENLKVEADEEVDEDE